jgi:hypothetical protein
MSALRELNQRPIAYYPIYRKITGSTTGGILLSQLMYWFAKKDKIFKTDIEIMDETFLTKKELENAKKLIKNLSFVRVSVEGVPAKTYYEIDWNLYEKEIGISSKNGETRIHETGNLVSPNGGNCTPPNGETIKVKSLNRDYTENTTEKKNIKKDFSFSLKKLTQLENTSQEYQEKLRAYAVVKDGGYSYESFLNHHLAKKSGFADWSRAYNTWLQNTQKFNKIDPTKYVRKIEHPTLPNVYAAYDANVAYDADTLTCLGEFRVIEREPTQEEIEAMYKQQACAQQQPTPQKRDIGGLLGNLAQGVRV